MIASLGVPVTLCVAVGGEVGTIVRKLLADEDVTVRSVPRESGNGWYVHDRREGSRDEIAENHGDPMVRHDIDELYSMALAEGLRARVSVLSGTADPSVVDPQVYRRLAADLSTHGGTVVADLCGAQLAAVLDDGGVAFLKVSHEELIADGRALDDSVAAVLARGGSLHDAVRTGAAAGALNVTRHGLGTGRAEAVHALIERVEVEHVH